jgi:hypothetical protein
MHREGVEQFSKQVDAFHPVDLAAQVLDEIVLVALLPDERLAEVDVQILLPHHALHDQAGIDVVVSTGERQHEEGGGELADEGRILAVEHRPGVGVDDDAGIQQFGYPVHLGRSLDAGRRSDVGVSQTYAGGDTHLRADNRIASPKIVAVPNRKPAMATDRIKSLSNIEPPVEAGDLNAAEASLHSCFPQSSHSAHCFQYTLNI